MLADVGESLKTAQALLGHSDLETTLNTYMHAIPDSQRRAVDRVARVLFSDVLNSEGGTETNMSTDWISGTYEMGGEPPRTRTWNPLIKSQLLYRLS